MIRTKKEYQIGVQRIAEAQQAIVETLAFCREQGYDEEMTEMMLESPRTVLAQVQTEVDDYERARDLDFDALPLERLGYLLMAVRVGQELTQQELAERAGLESSTISRYEATDYRGMAWDRAARLLDAAGVEVSLVVSRKTEIPDGDSIAKSISK